MKLISKASLQIQKPASEVYEAIVNPGIMTNFFISESSGRMKDGVELLWKFPEFPDRYPISKFKLEENKSVSFVWDPETIVTFTLEEQADNSTVVHVSEDGKALNEDNLEWVIQNTGGWSAMLNCMKAYLEYGIQLRKGAYEFMRK